MAIRLPLLLGLIISCTGLRADAPPESVLTFLHDHCFDCHSGEEAEAGFDVAGLEESVHLEKADWVRIFDRVRDGEMPPEDFGELPEGAREEFLDAAGPWIRESNDSETKQLGRVRARRLTNIQLERTLHDLMSIDIPLASLMSEEQRTEGFSNIADGQPMSHFQLESHLKVVDTALDEAFARAAESDEEDRNDFSARRLCRQNPRRRCRDPEMIDGEAVVWSSGLIFYGRITSTTVRESGWYRITFSASAVNRPKDHGVWCTVRSGRCNSGAPLMSWIGSFEASDDPKEMTFDAWIPAGHMLEIRPGDETLKRARFNGGQVGAGEGGPQNVPGVAMQGMTIERIHPGGDVDQVRDQIFGELKVKERRGKLAFQGDISDKELAKQIGRFARIAFRRRPTESELSPYIAVYADLIDSGSEPIDALRGCYRAILCSPRFLYLTESPGELDDHAIASRLSYLLWNSMPDRKLFELAEEGQLRDPSVLRQQVTRMLADRGAQQFIEDFSSQWLDLVDIDFTEPDRKLYRGFDVVVQNAMLDETHAFLTDLLTANASVSALVNSKHTYLNSRLARFYEIDGVDGDQIRRVRLKPEDHRGGLLSHGSILKVTANGTNTSPVLRGIWVSERILGVPIPPPPASVPAIEPDIRGAKTIRQQLEKHLADVQCAGCHKNIDPPGFALESFDAAGRWRDRYLVSERGKLRRGPEIDSSSKLADGRTFQNFEEFRDLLSADTRPIARNVAEKLLIYGTGAQISFADRESVEKIIESTADTNFGFRSLLDAVIVSPTFLSK